MIVEGEVEVVEDEVEAYVVQVFFVVVVLQNLESLRQIVVQRLLV